MYNNNYIKLIYYVSNNFINWIHFTRHAPESKHQYVDGFP